MTPHEVLKSWPTWSKANAETILASPAWWVQFLEGDLRRVPGDSAQVLVGLEIAFDDEPAVLVIQDSSVFPELHELKPVFAKLPPEIKLALVEKECGAFLQALEDLARRRISIRGLKDEVKFPDLAFSNGAVTFAVSALPWLVNELGRLENLDTAHPDIAGMTRPAEALYAEFEPQPVEAGDYLLPHAEVPRWIFERDPAKLQVIGKESGTLTFAEIAAGKLPPVPAADDFLLSNGLTARRATLCGKEVLYVQH